MPMDLKPGETVLFPNPYIPTDPNRVVVTTKRVAQFAPPGTFPIAEIEMDKIESMGRQTLRPYMHFAVILGLIASILVIGAIAKVLPAALQAGAEQKSGDKKPEEEKDKIEGRNADDDFPAEFGMKDDKKAQAEEKLKKLKKLKDNTKLGVPPLGALVMPVLMALAALGAAAGAMALRNRRQYIVFCRTSQTVHRLEVQDEMQQNMILTMIQAAHPMK